MATTALPPEVTTLKPAATPTPGGAFLITQPTPADCFFPEDFTEEHRQIAQTTADFAINEVLPQSDAIEAKDFAITRRLIKEAADLGLTSADIPEEYGGLEMDKSTSAIIAENISRQGSFSVAFSAHTGIGTLPLVWYGTRPSRSRNTSPASPPASSSAPTPSRNPPPARTPSTPAPARPLGRRQHLHPERRKDVDHQRRLRRPLHHLRQVPRHPRLRIKRRR